MSSPVGALQKLHQCWRGALCANPSVQDGCLGGWWRVTVLTIYVPGKRCYKSISWWDADGVCPDRTLPRVRFASIC